MARQYRTPGGVAEARHAEMLAEIETLRAARHEAALTPAERRWRERRIMTIPLYALGMTTPEVADALGIRVTALRGWVTRDEEIGWWARAAYEGRRWVGTIHDTDEKRRALYRQRMYKFRTRHTANRLPDGTVPEAPHGKAHGYSAYGCRCDACATAHTAEMREDFKARLKRTADNGGVAPVARHGASTYTGWGCRCDVCRAAIRRTEATP